MSDELINLFKKIKIIKSFSELMTEALGKESTQEIDFLHTDLDEELMPLLKEKLMKKFGINGNQEQELIRLTVTSFRKAILDGKFK